MTIRSVTDPKTPIGELLNAVAADGLLLETGGRTQYAVLPIEDELLDYLLERSRGQLRLELTALEQPGEL